MFSGVADAWDLFSRPGVRQWILTTDLVAAACGANLYPDGNRTVHFKQVMASSRGEILLLLVDRVCSEMVLRS